MYKPSHTVGWVLFAVLTLTLSLLPAALWAAAEQPPLHHVSATSCGECHQGIYAQWAESMHGRSTALKDGIHGALYRGMVGDPTQEGVVQKGSGNYPVCLQCHAPNAARDGKTKLDALEAYSEGVNCVACHTISGFKGTRGEGDKALLGAQAYTHADDSLQGPHGAYAGREPALTPDGVSGEKSVNPFQHRASGSLFKSSDICLGCHDQHDNPQGVPVCATGPEMRASGNSVTCQSCHMPVMDGFANHAMGGGHNLAMLKRGVALTVTATAGQATVTLKNSLPHNYPTGAPFRYVLLKVTALDAGGTVVWRNFKSNPMAEDPRAMLMLKLVGQDGKPAPAPKAAGIAGDTRLAPGESRSLAYDLPAGAVTVRAELHYGLMLPGMVAALGDKLPPEARSATLVARAEASL